MVHPPYLSCTLIWACSITDDGIIPSSRRSMYMSPLDHQPITISSFSLCLYPRRGARLLRYQSRPSVDPTGDALMDGQIRHVKEGRAPPGNRPGRERSRLLSLPLPTSFFCFPIPSPPVPPNPPSFHDASQSYIARSFPWNGSAQRRPSLRKIGQDGGILGMECVLYVRRSWIISRTRLLV